MCVYFFWRENMIYGKCIFCFYNFLEQWTNHLTPLNSPAEFNDLELTQEKLPVMVMWKKKYKFRPFRNFTRYVKDLWFFHLLKRYRRSPRDGIVGKMLRDFFFFFVSVSCSHEICFRISSCCVQFSCPEVDSDIQQKRPMYLFKFNLRESWI